MGCGASRSATTTVLELDNPFVVEVTRTWDRALKTVEKRTGNKMNNLIIKRKGWKTVRIFVSSTFKDFHQEREVLVKKVFPDLRAWCESKRLYLVECDLRWGVPKDFTTEGTLRACLGEIDRCYQDNVMPFFVNMTSERMGWVPVKDEIPSALGEEYKWVEGLSVTEMEIFHGAYRKDNPNAIFMLRDPSFLNDVPAEEKKLFVDGAAIAPCKLDVLKKKILERFQKHQVFKYKVEYQGVNPATGNVELGALDTGFSKTIFDFFKKRIEIQYPLVEETDLDEYEQKREQHEAFMKARCDNLIGRTDTLKDMHNYICGLGTDVPFVLVGGAGSGKSSVMAKAADSASTKAHEGSISGGGSKGWLVFYHFVGAVPGSTELLGLLQRLLKDMGVVKETTMPSDLDTAAQLACGAFSSVHSPPTIVIVDALNQLDEDQAALILNWVPRKLAPQIRLVFSMIHDTPQHKALVCREPQPRILNVTPLTADDRRLIVNELLGRYNKKLDDEQTEALLSKQSSENPLWLSIACEELRVFGHFRQISDKINHLPDGLLELEKEVLQRFEAENGGQLLIATLCLLEVSARGLLETELLMMLGNEDDLMPRDAAGQDGENEGKEKEDVGKEKDYGPLAALKWAEVYRALRPFLRPFGDSGEGRLDFYHRSLSKAVRKKYFTKANGDEDSDQYKWWHTKLADYFDKKCVNLSRKLEEYPFHLIAIKDSSRLEAFLTDWKVFDELFDEEYNLKLLKYWRLGSDFERMEESYKLTVNNLINQEKPNKEDIAHRCSQMGIFMAHCGRYAYAKELSSRALTVEEEELGARADKMGQYSGIHAYILDEEMKLEEYMYRSQLPRMRAIIEKFEVAVASHKDKPQVEIKNKQGRALNRLAFYYSGYSLRGGDDWLSASAAQEKAIESVNQAIAIFKELNDDVHVADSTTTKGVAYGRACPEQLKAYKEAEELATQVVGELHTCFDRLYLNMGIYYEEIGDYNTAYELFTKWYINCRDLYGKNHPKASRPIATLREPMYSRIAHEKGMEVPEFPE